MFCRGELTQMSISCWETEITSMTPTLASQLETPTLLRASSRPYLESHRTLETRKAPTFNREGVVVNVVLVPVAVTFFCQSSVIVPSYWEP